MIHLLKTWSFSHFKILKGNTAITLLGVSFGVALFTAVQAANQNIRDSFHGTVRQIAGKSQLEIAGGDSGFSEEDAVKIQKIPGIREWMPITLQSVSVPNRMEEAEVYVLGVDLFQESQFHETRFLESASSNKPADMNLLLEPGSILVSGFLADHFGLKPGAIFSFKYGSEILQTRVAGILKFQNDLPAPYGGYFAVMDIAPAQVLFHKLGRLDRIGLLAGENISLPQLQKETGEKLPGLHVQSPEQAGGMIDSMLASFNLNLTALSEISILVGMFLIYNTLSVLVVRRKVEIGILRSIGVSGREILWLMISEALLLGGLGSLLGIALGFFISQWVLKAVSLTVTSLFLKVFTQKVSLSFPLVVKSLAIGLGVSLVAAFHPAWEASRIPPRDILLRKEEIKTPGFSKGFFLSGVAGLLLASALVWAPPIHHIPVFGYLSALCLVTGLSLMIPALLFVFNQLLRAPFFKNRLVFFKLAGAGFFRQSGRNSIGIAALLMSVSLLISVTLMIHSFRKTIHVWIDQTIKADLVVEPSGWLKPGPLPFISPELGDRIKEIQGIAAVDFYREDHLFYRNEPFLLNSRNFSIHQQYSQYLFKKGESSKVLKEAVDQQEVLVSERFSLEHHLGEGDILTLSAPGGVVSFKIGGVFYDYTTQGGKVVMDRSLYLKYWRDPRVNVLAVYLLKEASGELGRVKSRMNEIVQKSDLFIITNREIKSKVLDIFDQTFAVTRALEWITIFISLLGVINTLLANILDQTREMGILRSAGVSRNQIGKMTLYEAGWMALTGNLLGAAGGWGLSLILIYVINKQSFLWTIQFDFSWMIFFRTFLIVTLTALLAAYFPAREAAKGGIAEAVHYE